MKNEQSNTTEKGMAYDRLLCAVCPDCGGDGRETCHNPDHGFIHGMMGWHEIGRLGCPVCGHDPNGKVKNGGKCETCDGVGRVTIKTAEEFLDAMDYDMEVQLVEANCTQRWVYDQ